MRPENHITHWRPLIDDSVHTSYGWDQTSGCPAYSSSTAAGEYTARCFVRRPWFFCNQGLTNSPRLPVINQAGGGRRTFMHFSGNTSTTRRQCEELPKRRLWDVSHLGWFWEMFSTRSQLGARDNYPQPCLGVWDQIKWAMHLAAGLSLAIHQRNCISQRLLSLMEKKCQLPNYEKLNKIHRHLQHQVAISHKKKHEN